jgi:hypothetical protein
LVAQSLWTNTFLYDGPAAHDILHLNIPTLQVGLLGVPPRRSGPSATETAEARAEVDMVITHPDVPSLGDLLNLVDKQILEHPNPLAFTPHLSSTATTSTRVILLIPWRWTLIWL